MFKQKLSTLFLVLFCPFVLLGQDVNAFDANGQRHGTWRKFYEGTKQLRYEGQFEHGKEVGEFRFYILDKRVSRLAAVKNFSKVHDTVEVTFYTLQKKPISRGKMIGKTYIGEWVTYHKNSDHIMVRETFDREGILQGERTVYYDNGELAEKARYRDGMYHGLLEQYSESGNLIKSYRYNQGVLDGPSKHYDADGNLIVEGLYKDGKKKGLWHYYDQGKLVKTVNQDYKPKRRNRE